MAKEEGKMACDCKHMHKGGGGGGAGALGGVYGLAFIGAAVYFIQHADTFWMGVLGLLKAIVWPALLIYKVFTMLNM